MSKNGFETYTPDSAPAGARELLSNTASAFGFLPNLLGGMAVAPALVEGYLTLAGIFDRTSLSAAERQIVLLAVSRFNGCDYCMSAHTAISAMQGVPASVTEALRTDHAIADPRLEALRRFATKLVEQRGCIDAATVEDFLDAGYTRQHIGEVLLGVGLKTLSNYFNHIAGTELDEPFAAVAWSAPEQ
jgi:uncharacterized peroxidase-related enzyme